MPLNFSILLQNFFMNTTSSFFPAYLLQTKYRLASSAREYAYLLDKNEQIEDMPDWLKINVLKNAMDMAWNRYPNLDNTDIEQSIAASMGLNGNQVVLGSGSAMLITTLLNFFGLQRRQIVIAQPSYSLFDYHCKTYDIPYTPWMLNTDLEYDYSLLPTLYAGSVLFIVSPNNPVGNEIPRAMLEKILRNNPNTLVILDAVYAEFGENDFQDLLAHFPNLIIMRSMSKEMPVAALRLGYLCGSEAIINTVRKLLLPFTINPLSLAFAKHMIFEPSFCELTSSVRDQIITERNRLSRLMKECIDTRIGKVYHSSGNFLLVRIYDESTFVSVLQALENASIKVLNTSGMPQLKNTFRISIGDFNATDAVMECISEVLEFVDTYDYVR